MCEVHINLDREAKKIHYFEKLKKKERGGNIKGAGNEIRNQKSG